MADLNLTTKEKNLLIKLAVFVAVVYGLVWGSGKYAIEYTRDVREINSALNNELREYRSRLSEINEEEILQSQYVEAYNSYKDKSLIMGPEVVEDAERSAMIDETTRLFLLERLNKIREERKFFLIDYNITKPANLPASFSAHTAGSDVAVRVNLMNLKMPLLHSLDLLMLLNDFYDREVNRFTPVRCKLSFQRGAEAGDGTADDNSMLLELRENIYSSCDLVWLTVYDPKQGVVTEAASSDG